MRSRHNCAGSTAYLDVDAPTDIDRHVILRDGRLRRDFDCHLAHVDPVSYFVDDRDQRVHAWLPHLHHAINPFDDQFLARRTDAYHRVPHRARPRRGARLVAAEAPKVKPTTSAATRRVKLIHTPRDTPVRRRRNARDEGRRTPHGGVQSDRWPAQSSSTQRIESKK